MVSNKMIFRVSTPCNSALCSWCCSIRVCDLSVPDLCLDVKFKEAQFPEISILMGRMI